jgi:uncharacterized protein YabN with tetrapyrrole methylase and pyrophosphatase domain
MVRRHPHVFGDTEVRDNDELLRNWEAMKAEEKRAAGKDKKDDDSSLLDGVSTRLPALMESHQLSTKAARVGFDWQRLEDIFDKLHEEIEELREAIRERGDARESTGASALESAAGNVRESAAVAQSEGAARDDTSGAGDAPRSEADDVRVREELGDVLFAVSNIARHLQVEPEAALKLTNRKFRRRFRHVERGLRERGRELGAATLEEMEELWQQAKRSDE